jgi:hypothetical protein
MGVNLTAGVKNYLSFHDVTNATAIGAGRRLHKGRPFRVVAVRWRASTDTGSTIVGLHKNGNTTPDATNTQDPSAANEDMTWRGVGLDYTASDLLHFSLQPTSVSSTTVHVEIDVVYRD